MDGFNWLNLNTAEEFDTIANNLLNNYVLVVGAREYRLREIEFYLKSDVHPDPYVHGHEIQRTVGKWYFHRASSRVGDAGYRGGTFKGVDLTFGEGVIGGILIRSMQLVSVGGRRPDYEQLIEGPCNCVNDMLAVVDCMDVRELDNKCVDVTRGALTLVRRELNQLPVYTARRVGLNETRDINYWAAPYRYHTEPGLKKDRAGIVEGLVDFHGFDLQGAKALTRN